MMSSQINSRSFFNQILPAQPCALCGTPSHDGIWCKACAAELPHLGDNHCPVCALPTPQGNICGHCLRHPPPFDHTVAAFAYAFPVDKLVQALKFSENLTLALQLADALAQRIDERPAAIVAMPLHPQRLRERGFNQSELLAQHLARFLGIPVLPDACTRIRNTAPQSTLPWKERDKNMRKAFTCNLDLQGKHVAVVDDVMTTGASIGALSATLRRAGATRISAWVVARTLPH